MSGQTHCVRFINSHVVGLISQTGVFDGVLYSVTIVGILNTWHLNAVETGPLLKSSTSLSWTLYRSEEPTFTPNLTMVTVLLCLLQPTKLKFKPFSTPPEQLTHAHVKYCHVTPVLKSPPAQMLLSVNVQESPNHLTYLPV